MSLVFFIFWKEQEQILDYEIAQVNLNHFG